MNKSKFAAILIGFAGLASALPAAAQTFYIGGQVGNSEVNRGACPDQGICDRNDTSYTGNVGFMFTRNWGVEFSYLDFGKLLETDDGMGNTGHVKTKGGDAMVVAALPFDQIGLSRNFSAYVKGGAYYAKSKLTATDAAGNTTEVTSNSKQWAWGVGLQYQVFRHLAIRGEWMLYNNVGGKEVGFRGDVQNLVGGLLLTF